jgi:hypothetical protein
MFIATFLSLTIIPFLMGLFFFINPPHLPEYYHAHGLLQTLLSVYLFGLIPVGMVSPLLILGWTMFGSDD